MPLTKPPAAAIQQVAAAAAGQQQPVTDDAVVNTAAGSSLQHSTSLPAGATLTKAAAAEAATKPKVPALLHSASMPAARAAEASAAAAVAAHTHTSLQPIAAAQPTADRAPALPMSSSTQEPPPVVATTVKASAVAAATPATTAAAPAPTANAPAAMSAGGSQKSRSKIWMPPSAINAAASPEHSSGTSTHQAASQAQATAVSTAAAGDRDSGAHTQGNKSSNKVLKRLAQEAGDRLFRKMRKSADSSASPVHSPKASSGGGVSDRPGGEAGKAAKFTAAVKVSPLGDDSKARRASEHGTSQSQKRKVNLKAINQHRLQAVAAQHARIALGKQGLEVVSVGMSYTALQASVCRLLLSKDSRNGLDTSSLYAA